MGDCQNQKKTLYIQNSMGLILVCETALGGKLQVGIARDPMVREIILEDGVSIDPAIRKLPVPTNAKQT